MSAQAGVVYFDGQPMESQAAAVIAGLEAMSVDRVSAVTDSGAVLACGGWDTWTGESQSHAVRHGGDGLVMTWDGRLDNRDDLRCQVGRLAPDACDAAIALAVFARDGIDGLRSLVGEWSLVVWDRRRRTLHLARDYMGVRPLYYRSDGRSVAWSSSLAELVQRVGCDDALDDRFAARFMALRHSTDVTPYRQVCEAPTATCISFSGSGGPTSQRFWHLESNLIRYRDRRRYEDELRALWREAVAARLRVNGTVWAELSGGLDSSAVVCMADVLIAGRRVEASALQPMSHVTLHSTEGDERRFIVEVERQVGVNSHVFGVEQHEDDVDDEAAWVTPYALRGVGLAVARRVQAGGGRVILSGRAGDAVMGCVPDNSVAVFDDIARLRIATACASARRWSRATRKPLVEIVGGLLREGVRSMFPAFGAAVRGDAQRRGADLLTPGLRAMLDDGPEAAAAATRWSKRPLATMLQAYSTEALLNLPNVPPGLCYTFPFVHRPLVEFVLAIPGEELSAPNETRRLMRRSFDGLLPRRVRLRTSKGYYPPAAMRAVRRRAASARPVERLEVVRRGWIDPEKLDAAIRVLLDGGGSTGGEVRRALRLEEWLTSRHRRAPAATPKGKEVNVHEVFNA